MIIRVLAPALPHLRPALRLAGPARPVTGLQERRAARTETRGSRAAPYPSAAPARRGRPSDPRRADPAAASKAADAVLAEISSMQVKRHAGTRGGCRRGDRVCVRGDGWRQSARGSVGAARAAAGRSRFPGEAGGNCRTARTRARRAAGCGVPEVCTPCELQRWARVNRTAS